jgi:ELWxxDGT repeat protein
MDSLSLVLVETSRAVQDRLFFQTRSPETATLRLWVTDGTLDGTQLLRAFDGTGDKNLFQFLEVKGELAFFYGTKDQWTVWLCDGTPAGTRSTLTVSDVSFPEDFEPDLAVLNEQLVFTAHRGLENVLFAVDAAQGKLRELLPGKDYSSISSRFWVGDGKVLFQATRKDQTNVTVYETDGSLPGTKEFATLPEGLYPAFTESRTPSQPREWLASLQGDILFFSAENDFGNLDLWLVDRNTGEVRMLTYDCEQGQCPVPGPNTRFLVQGDRLVFKTLFREPLSSEYVVSIWSIEVDGMGPEKIKDLCVAHCGSEYAPEIRQEGSELFFLARPNDEQSFELWVTNGTTDGTSRITTDGLAFESNVGTSAPPFWNGPPQLIRHPDGRLFFAAADEIHGRELWVKTKKSVVLVSDLERHVAAFGSAWSANFQDGPLYFAIGEQVFQLQGDPNSYALEEIFSTSALVLSERLFLCGQHLIWLTRGSSTGSQLWRISTETGAGELLLERKMLTFPATAVGDFIYFPRLDEFFYMDIWKSDGTAENTEKAFSVPLAFPQGIFDLVPLGEKLLAMGVGAEPDRSGYKYVLWLSDGTQAGTEELFSTSPDNSQDSIDFDSSVVEWQGKAFFVRFSGGRSELWSVDPDTKLAERRYLMGELPLSDFPGIYADDNRFYLYFASHGEDGEGKASLLSTTDGTNWQTLRDFPSSSSSPLVSARGNIFFVGDDGIHGQELWKTDGTPEGTVLVKDISPGRLSAEPFRLRATKDWVYFDAATSFQGRELWVTDGTAEGTRLVVDLAPGPESSSPRPIFNWRDVYFFTGDDGVVDDALWSIPLPGMDGPVCQPSATALCLSGNRFQVEIDWLDFEGNRGRGNAVQLTPDTGYFWFFSENNVEVVTKVLDARVINDHQWVFFGALSNVEYTLKVTDTETGARRFYFNPGRNFASVGDTEAFGPNGAQVKSLGSGTERIMVPLSDGDPAALVTESFNPAAMGAACAPSSTRLCLTDGRFSVEAQWTDFQANSGVGHAVELTEDTGYFWFFTDNNVEVVLKVLDARVFSDHFWVFYGALSNVEYDLVVTDTETGAVRTYHNPSGNFASVGDTAAF